MILPLRLLTGVLSASLLVHLAAPQTQQPVFKARVEGIRVDVLVTENHQPVRGLQATDFEIFDNGVRQDVAAVERDGKPIPLDVVLALDTSDSVAGERLEQLRAASNRLVDALAATDQAAVVTFNDLLWLPAPPTGDLAAVKRAIAAIRPSGATSLIDAAYAGMVLGESDARRGLLVLFTDGLDTSSYLGREAVVDTARRTDVVVYAVAVDVPRRSPFLEDVTSQTGGRLLELRSTRDLPALFAEILSEFRSRYVLSYSPRGVSTTGWHRIAVRVKDRPASVKARAGYLAGR